MPVYVQRLTRDALDPFCGDDDEVNSDSPREPDSEESGGSTPYPSFVGEEVSHASEEKTRNPAASRGTDSFSEIVIRHDLRPEPRAESNVALTRNLRRSSRDTSRKEHGFENPAGVLRADCRR